MTLDDFYQLQRAHWGSPAFHYCELIRADELTQPLLDHDHWLDHEPTIHEIQQAFDACKEDIFSMCQADENFDWDKHVLQASRHGYVPSKGKWKISWRFVITGLYKIKWEQINAFIHLCGSPEHKGLSYAAIEKTVHHEP